MLLRVLIAGVLSRFLSDRFLLNVLCDRSLFKFLSDRVLYESTVTDSSSGSLV